MPVRFDDHLRTVLAADMTPGFGAQSAWRQLVDLAGRGRVAADDDVISRLAALRPSVPTSVRMASARALAFERPDARLVAFFAEDEIAVAAPVLRTATLDPSDWLALLPALAPVGRSVLRSRRDLPADVVRGLESFGSVDFTIGHDAPATVAVPVAPDTPVDHIADAPPPLSVPVPVAEIAVPDVSRSPSPFVPLGEVARGLPLVAEALRRAEEPGADRFEIADIVARIDAFRRDQPLATPAATPRALDRFDFATDPTGTIRWIEGGGRAGLIGVSMVRTVPQGLARIDGVVAGAVRRRDRIADGRLEIGGTSELAGSWRLSAQPDFDPATGRFVGYAGTARRPARHEQAEAAGANADGLRQLVHELRTPANAVAGFAEFIETQLLGPVSPTYRERAGTIRRHAADLLAAIEDLDTAARIEGGALSLAPGEVAVAALLRSAAYELAPLATARGATLAMSETDALIAVDERAAERLVSRLLAALLATASAGETIGVTVATEGDRILLAIDRPRALAALSSDALFALGGGDPEEGGAPLLGIGFTLRLARNLAAELGGALSIGADRLTLRLPTVSTSRMGQASNH